MAKKNLLKRKEEDIEPTKRAILTPEGTDYVDIVKSEVKELDSKFITGEGQPANIVYYCRNKECRKMIERPQRIAKTLRFKCPECGQERIAFGNQESIENYYRLKNERATSKKLMENI